MLEEVQFKEIFGSISVNANFYSPIRLKYVVHFLASCMALLGCLKLTAKVCFP